MGLSDTPHFKPHQEREGYDILHTISDISTGETVGLEVSLEGYIHIYANGRHFLRTQSSLPIDKPLFGMVTMIGNCMKVKSQLLDALSMQSCV